MPPWLFLSEIWKLSTPPCCKTLWLSAMVSLHLSLLFRVQLCFNFTPFVVTSIALLQRTACPCQATPSCFFMTSDILLAEERMYTHSNTSGGALPFVFILSVSTTRHALHSLLPHSTATKLQVIYRSHTSCTCVWTLPQLSLSFGQTAEMLC